MSSVWVASAARTAGPAHIATGATSAAANRILCICVSSVPSAEAVPGFPGRSLSDTALSHLIPEIRHLARLEVAPTLKRRHRLGINQAGVKNGIGGPSSVGT